MFNQSCSKIVSKYYDAMPQKWCLAVNADIFYGTYNLLSSSYFGWSREKNIILGNKMDFANILQSMKVEKCQIPQLPD